MRSVACGWCSDAARPVQRRRRACDCAQAVRAAQCLAAGARHGGPRQAQSGAAMSRAIGAAMLDHAPAADLAMRAAIDLDGRHAAHEGLRVLARLRVGLRHGQQLPRQRQALSLGRRGQQPVVADALEARRQHMLQQPGDELLARHGDRALAAACRRRARASSSLSPAMATSRSLPMARAVGVAAQVVQHRGRPGQRRLGVHHPVVPAQRLQALCARQCRVGRVARQLGRGAGLLQRLQELAPNTRDSACTGNRKLRERLGWTQRPVRRCRAAGPRRPSAHARAGGGAGPASRCAAPA